MRLPCPWCGPRDLSEFVYRGDASVARPLGDDPNAMADYIYPRENPAAALSEHWFHAHGCRAWFVLKRNTRTHEILAESEAP